MGIEAVVLKQYQNKVNQALKQFGDYAIGEGSGDSKLVRLEEDSSPSAWLLGAGIFIAFFIDSCWYSLRPL